MQEALSLARLALGSVSPNPAVGAILVQDDIVVGRGYTQPPGQAHAEVVALQQAGEAAKGSSLYVTLEPCCHYGKTPPCTEAIIRAGVSEVHAAMIDPNPVVNGKGLAALQQAGIKTVLGESKEEAQEIVEAYIKYITTGIPFVTAKFAMSLDGKIATGSGDSKWISSESSRSYSHSLRNQHDSIMAGINTVLKDDPRLTVRSGSGKGGTAHRQPVRVIVDSYARTPLNAQILAETGRTIIAVGEEVSEQRKQQLIEKGAEIIELPVINGFIDLKQLISELGKKDITSVMVEGGGSVLGSLFDQQVVDKVVAFIAPIIIGGDLARSPVGGQGVDKVTEAFKLTNVKYANFENDIMVIGYLR
ncbi:MAG: bifunctional diaminohydroxyphosphoribosylaminopyrimidine deaminase/5-amino-6-(5-phosphoribosylamino)uracil reductase RibD [Dehalococcoidales bacterium]|jgi:diaminohydroxyphosphoribosylaminopyrimidine deaminase/5-amino-6-(5-phosphoribosylamino)uracil reductase|nr:bifunctional diaminohydroxyphosphoribosylaminopyrimidine deaminase/5-amino-6-(5-phosphoribosylamino)uracil reductase RibD [Dehalococcoidales bacterium]MDX9986006.1 bifunctional diaminohydroxyphosphoribosylaminopyrimidine deaminase/5-amino-6-(5-phosphoribosylamino)uracil reductase RibD [Dehalococcoidales bacterium]